MSPAGLSLFGDATWVQAAAAAVAGLFAGSFVGVVADRVPRGECVVWPRSFCRVCKRALPLWDLLPLLNVLLLRGRCRFCRAPIPLELPLLEAATAALFGLGVLRHGVHPALLAHLGGVLLFLSCGLIDARHGWIPDRITLPGTLAGLASNLSPAFAGLPGLPAAAAGAALGLAAGFAIRWASRGGMGPGDAKFLALTGSFLGVEGVLFVLFGGAILGCLHGLVRVARGTLRFREPFPFGPYLAAVAIVAALW